MQETFPGVGGTIILVREEDAPEAEKIIDEYRKLPPLDDETADITLSVHRGSQPPDYRGVKARLYGLLKTLRRCGKRTPAPWKSGPSGPVSRRSAVSPRAPE